MEKILNHINSLESLAIELETELCKRPAISPDSGGEGELEKCDFLEAWLRKQGFSDLRRYDAPDSRAKGGVRPNLIATVEGTEPGGCFWIMSHIDVVPPGEISLWKNDPWKVVVEEKDGKKILIGRGVEDNQQGLVSSVIAALALMHCGIKPRKTLKLLFVSDEENGSKYGIGWMMEKHPELFSASDTALVPDSGDEQGVGPALVRLQVVDGLAAAFLGRHRQRRPESVQWMLGGLSDGGKDGGGGLRDRPQRPDLLGEGGALGFAGGKLPVDEESPDVLYGTARGQVHCGVLPVVVEALASPDVSDAGLGDHHAFQAPGYLDRGSAGSAGSVCAACCAIAG